jgi:hypothetical protein
MVSELHFIVVWLCHFLACVEMALHDAGVRVLWRKAAHLMAVGNQKEKGPGVPNSPSRAPYDPLKRPNFLPSGPNSSSFQHLPVAPWTANKPPLAYRPLGDL